MLHVKFPEMQRIVFFVGRTQAWDHADFVRMSDQSVLFQSTWNPLVVLQVRRNGKKFNIFLLSML